MSSYQNPLNAYKQTAVKTASPGKLIVMLYDEAIKQLDLAISLIDSKSRQLDKVHNALVKVQDIVTELMAGLDFEKGGEIAKNLLSIYLFVNEKVKEGNMKKTTEPLNQTKSLMADLRSAWAQIAGRAEIVGGTATGVNIAG